MSPLKPTIYILSRFCGTPKSFAFMICGSGTKYPRSFLNTFSIVARVFPPLWLRKPFTFSRKTTFGFFRLIISATSKNKVPLVSSNPPRFPAIENAWHGNPAHNISNPLGINAFVSALAISPNGHSPKFVL